MKINPAILVQDINLFYKQINTLKKYFNYFQVDIANNTLVPNKTIQVEDIIKTIKFNLPIFKNLQFDFHLMVKDYEKEIKKLEKLRNEIDIKNILIHASLNPNIEYLISKYPFFHYGLVLDKNDLVNTIKTAYKLTNIPIIQIMTIVSGFQGQPFIPELLNKIEQLRLSGYRNKISLDGGVNDKTIPVIMSKKYKPDVLGIGSYLTKADNLEERISFLKKHKCL